jgi:hypothetical protein
VGNDLFQATTTYEGGKMKTVVKPNDSKLTEHTILRDICPKGQLVQVGIQIILKYDLS